MSISRLAILTLTAAITLMVSAAFLISPPAAQAQQQAKPKMAETPFSFTKIFEGPDVILETDASTYTAMLDDDDDLMVAGIFRLTRKNAAPGEKAVFVTLTTAVCGYNGVIVMYSKDFTLDGQPAGGTSDPRPMMIRPNTPGGATYLALCSSATKPTPADPSYKAPDRYTKFWV